jgi:iron only hydrogenase large subunit-like protein
LLGSGFSLSAGAPQIDGKRVLNFASAYGFRNIQNLVRKVKLGKCEYHFVEIMACPSGCLNGGGQIKPRKGQTTKDLIQSLEAAYLQEVSYFALDPHHCFSRYWDLCGRASNAVKGLHQNPDRNPLYHGAHRLDGDACVCALPSL